MKKIISYLPILYVCYLFLAYTRLYYYYGAFKINIISFVSITDVLFLFIPQFIVISTSYYFYIISYALEKSNSEEEKIIKPSRFKTINFIFLMYLLANSTLTLLILFLNWKGYKLEWLYQLFDWTFVVLIFYAITKYDKHNVVLTKHILMSLGIICLLSYKIGQYSGFRAEKLKDGIAKGEINVSFNYEQDTIITDKNKILIGQTSIAVFIYNRVDSSTRVYSIENIKNLKVK